MKRPTFDVHEIPDSSHPAWKNQEDRAVYEEDIRMHLFDVVDRLETGDIDDEEKQHWTRVIQALGDLAEYYRSRGFEIKQR